MVNAAIIGASGYSGAELFRLLNSRDDVRVAHAVAFASIGKRVDELYPAFSGRTDLSYESFREDQLEGIDVAFVALPSGEAMSIVPSLVQHVGRVIDLSGDFRLESPVVYKEFYQHDHVAPHLLCEAIYGLPELQKEAIATARLVANPGCYPTSTILALLPALKNGIIASEGIVINALSGVSGAGRTASVDYSFTEINENIRAYKITRHQHLPEIQSVLQKSIGRYVSLSFVPHLVPITRGIYTTIHADLNSSLDAREVFEVYTEFYRNAPFVRIKHHALQIKDVLHTNYCDIACMVDYRTKKLIIISVIDNLMKGAAGQAVQNMNIMFNISQERGLL